MKFNIYYIDGPRLRIFQGGIIANSREEAVEIATSWRNPGGRHLVGIPVKELDTIKCQAPRQTALVHSVDKRNANKLYNRMISNGSPIWKAELESGIHIIKK